MEEQELTWTDLDRKAVDTARVLAADAVEKVGNGHPGTAMSLAPAAYLLFQKLMRHDPSDPQWTGRDRFILSPGHTSLTLYIQLFLSGYGLELEDLKSLRTWGSKTPGHPEYRHTAGVEITTGPLGQGLASSVGFAFAQRRLRGLLDADAPQGESPFDHTTWVIASDGDMQEGVTSEASSLAGHQELGNLVVIYDENHISIEDDTDISFTEDVLKRYEAYGWHTQRVDWTKTGEYVEDVAELYNALLAAKAETSKPSIISLRTIIGYPAPNKQNTGKIHGSALGKDEVAALKEALGNPEFKAVAPAISKDALTLVKYKDEGVLPLSPEKTKRVMIVNVKGPDSPMAKLAAIAMGGGAGKKSPVEKFCDKLNEKGFDAFIYESPLDKMMKEVAAGKPFNLNLYFAGKNAISEFVSGMDIVITFFNVANGHPVFGMSKGGGEIPWYVHELPVIGISVNKPTMLADAPMLRTYINTYDSNEDTLDALVEALMEGPDAFKGTDPIDSYCGMFDTHM